MARPDRRRTQTDKGDIGMSDKYIIKNCPALGFQIGYYCSDRADYCKDCTDCVLKQIVEKCRNIKKDHYWGMREIRFANEILQLLDIQEVE